VIAGHQRHRHAHDLVERERGADERHVKRERDQDDAADQDRVGEEREPRSVLDHQYWTLRSM
jgi:hypothetical protein